MTHYPVTIVSVELNASAERYALSVRPGLLTSPFLMLNQQTATVYLFSSARA